mmetsp:Transcript_23915/g.71892  ORF Transcript_23915/g.71892 Transcript_23915/m.71892 type:complete len:216 (-) Transcript_23915:514-1161(-)
MAEQEVALVSAVRRGGGAVASFPARSYQVQLRELGRGVRRRPARLVQNEVRVVQDERFEVRRRDVRRGPEGGRQAAHGHGVVARQRDSVQDFLVERARREHLRSPSSRKRREPRRRPRDEEADVDARVRALALRQQVGGAVRRELGVDPRAQRGDRTQRLHVRVAPDEWRALRVAEPRELAELKRLDARSARGAARRGAEVVDPAAPRFERRVVG